LRWSCEARSEGSFEESIPRRREFWSSIKVSESSERSRGLSQAATKRLEHLDVEVRLGVGVDGIDADAVTVAGERILSKVVI
jgi:hypothetical protein